MSRTYPDGIRGTAGFCGRLLLKSPPEDATIIKNRQEVNMKKTIAILTAFIMLVLPCISAGAAESRTTELRTTGPGYAAKVPAEVPASAQEWEVLRIVNAERTNAGLQPLTMLPALQSATDVRALELIQSFSHTRPNGSSCFTAIAEAGLNYISAGENIAAGYGTPAQVMDGWMNSSGHRANILNSGFKHIGVGYTYSQGTDYGSYWVQLFCTGPSCAYSGFEILGELDAGTPVDSLGLAGRFTCGEGRCYMPLTSASCVGDVTSNGVRTVTFSCFGLTASISFGGASPTSGDVDLNGVIDSTDALLCLRCALGVMELDEMQFAAADVNGNGQCDSTDALLILRSALGL